MATLIRSNNTIEELITNKDDLFIYIHDKILNVPWIIHGNKVDADANDVAICKVIKDVKYNCALLLAFGYIPSNKYIIEDVSNEQITQICTPISNDGTGLYSLVSSTKDTISLAEYLTTYYMDDFNGIDLNPLKSINVRQFKNAVDEFDEFKPNHFSVIENTFGVTQVSIKIKNVSKRFASPKQNIQQTQSVPDTTINHNSKGHKKTDGSSKSQYNIVISGPPGVGKSHLVENNMIPFLLSGNSKPNDKDEYVERITLTPSTTYEDFFGCYKPKTVDDKTNPEKKQVIYDFVPGIFLKSLKKAIDSEDNYVLVIEELNRVDVYDVFGQVFQMLDRNQEGQSEYGISVSEDMKRTLKECKNFKENEKLRIPKNLYIICTMNSADQGVQFLDTAFRRRFDFIYMDINGEVYASQKAPVSNGPKIHNQFGEISEQAFEKYRKFINTKMENAKPPFAEDKMISSYFIKQYEIEDDGKKIVFYDAMDFVVKILGYLIQDVYRERDDINEILGNITTMKRLLSTYTKTYDEMPPTTTIDENCLDKILNIPDKNQKR